jgi:hypothetical protein
MTETPININAPKPHANALSALTGPSEEYQPVIGCEKCHRPTKHKVIEAVQLRDGTRYAQVKCRACRKVTIRAVRRKS